MIDYNGTSAPRGPEIPQPIANLIEQQQARIAELEKREAELVDGFRAEKRRRERAEEIQEHALGMVDDWKHKKFARFNEEECWLFQDDDGYDNLESLVCPVVMSKDKAIELTASRKERDELAATVERLRGGLNDAIEALVAETMDSGTVEDGEIHDLRTLELSTPSTNLNTALREAFIKGFKSGYIKSGYNNACDDYDEKGSLFDFIEKVANQRYPDKK